MPAVTSRIGGTPTRRIAEFLVMPTTKGSCYVPSPRSPLSGTVAGWAAKGMRFCVRALHSLVACSLDGGEAENLIVGCFLKCVLSSRPSLRRFRYERHSSSFFPALPRSLARCCSRARRRFDVLLRSPRRTPFGSGFPTTNFPRNMRAAAVLRTKFLAGASAESTSRPWERGTSRRFAQECPE